MTIGLQILRYKHASWKARKIELSLKKKRAVWLRRRKSWRITDSGDAAEQAAALDQATPGSDSDALLEVNRDGNDSEHSTPGK